MTFFLTQVPTILQQIMLMLILTKCQTWTLTDLQTTKLKIYLREMEWFILDLKLQDSVRNIKIYLKNRNHITNDS